MSDEQVVEEPKVEPVPAPTIDQEALNQSITEGIKQGLSELRPVQQPTPSYIPPAQPDPIAQVIAPVVAPALQAVYNRAEAAMDAATFYSTPEPEPEYAALKGKYRDLIEKVYQEELNYGRLTPRWAIWNFLKGGQAAGEFADATLAVRERQKAAAQGAGVIGPGTGRPVSLGPTQASQMSAADLDKALEGVTF